MSSAAFAQRRILVIGQRLAAIAEQALPGAQFEIAGPDAFDGQNRPAAPADLVLIDGDPIADIRATRQIRRVWCAGVEHRVTFAA